ncbi:MAG: endonuclease/exonuclease/phosphatase family protein [Candidatus Nanoarchaeia archaeon]|nr:endonuclease/exonuclease/phosphatase family protein [Candidatus Nanoarchaeia archaeon]
MNVNKSLIFIIFLTTLAVVSFSFFDYSPKNPVSIASWNLNIFGDKKAGNETLMQEYYNIISQFDIIFLQELRDVDGSALTRLCELFNNTFNCFNSSRAGSTISKEQYYLLYNKEFTLLNYTDYNLVNITGFERSPIKLDFNYNNINFTIYGIHVKPDNAKSEIANLEDLILNKGNIIVLGDLNADCSYYKKGNDFIDWHWTINEDTTVANSDCAYDNIIINQEFYNYFIQSNVFKTNITENLSDHYLIYSIFDLS